MSPGRSCDTESRNDGSKRSVENASSPTGTLEWTSRAMAGLVPSPSRSLTLAPDDGVARALLALAIGSGRHLFVEPAFPAQSKLEAIAETHAHQMFRRGSRRRSRPRRRRLRSRRRRGWRRARSEPVLPARSRSTRSGRGDRSPARARRPPVRALERRWRGRQPGTAAGRHRLAARSVPKGDFISQN